MLCTIFNPATDQHDQVDIPEGPLVFDPSPLWPENGGFTIVVLADMSENDQAEQILDRLGIPNTEDSGTDGMAEIEDSCPVYHLQEFNGRTITHDDKLEFQEYFEAQFIAARAAAFVANRAVRALGQLELPHFTLTADSADDLQAQILSLDRVQIEAKLVELFGDDLLDRGVMAVLIPSRSKIQEAADNGISLGVTYLDVEVNRQIDGWTVPKLMAANVTDTAGGEFFDYVEDIECAVEWMEEARDDFELPPNVQALENQGQGRLDLVMVT